MSESGKKTAAVKVKPLEPMGPRPGFAIFSFWQGILEMAFRSVTAVSIERQ